MRKVFVAAATLLALLLPLGIPVHSPVYAQTPPHVFVGEATLDGTPVPDGTVIQAIIDGRLLSGSDATVQNGKFTLFAAQPDGGSTSLKFAVGGFVAEQSYSWQIGGATVLRLTALTQLPAVRLSFDPAPPARIKRGDRFQLLVKADTGVYQVTSGKIQVGYDINVLRVDTERANAPTGPSQDVTIDTGSHQVGWHAASSASTSTGSGQLETIQMVVLDTAPAGDTLITVHASLTGTTGELFPLEPDQLSYRVNVEGLSGDFNEDQAVDLVDLAALGVVWGKQVGQSGFETRFDLDRDGLIGVGDLVGLIRSYSIRE
ncbi:MAG: hypothetical protein O2909_13010 [Chloroflexi bacterium]|nr:hypothetical protein [Chloroflexota bacterium]MDA1220329.1 hypothetical protein [Chloroflexota bacterium]